MMTDMRMFYKKTRIFGTLRTLMIKLKTNMEGWNWYGAMAEGCILWMASALHPPQWLSSSCMMMIDQDWPGWQKENLCFWFHVYQYNQSHVHLQPLSLSSSPKFKLFVHKEMISKSLSVGNKAVWSTIIKRLTETGKSQINMIIVYLLDLCWICVVSVLYSCFSHFNLKLHSVHCRLYTEVFNKTCLHTAHFTR